MTAWAATATTRPQRRRPDHRRPEHHPAVRDAQTLERFLADPPRTAPSTATSYAGVADAKDEPTSSAISSNGMRRRNAEDSRSSYRRAVMRLKQRS
jgi:hypothetical protein